MCNVLLPWIPRQGTKTTICVAREGKACPPASQTHGFVSQTKLSKPVHYLLLDLNTCLTPGAQNWTDLNYTVYFSVWDGCGPKCCCSGSNLWIKKKSVVHQQPRQYVVVSTLFTYTNHSPRKEGRGALVAPLSWTFYRAEYPQIPIEQKVFMGLCFWDW